jgi:hypothetical protein
MIGIKILAFLVLSIVGVITAGTSHSKALVQGTISSSSSQPALNRVEQPGAMWQFIGGVVELGTGLGFLAWALNDLNKAAKAEEQEAQQETAIVEVPPDAVPGATVTPDSTDIPTNSTNAATTPNVISAASRFQSTSTPSRLSQQEFETQLDKPLEDDVWGLPPGC